MDKKSRRLEKLRALVEKYGGIAEFARSTTPGADKPIDTTYVSQILNGHRSFGEKSALNMARRAGLPDNYFDSDPDSIPPEISDLLRTVETLTESGKMSLEEIRKMTELLKART